MILTPYGYTMLDVDKMPEILTLDEFNTMTANKYKLDGRVQNNIDAATTAIRQYCGWHIADMQTCELVLNAQDLTITQNYTDMLIQLPYRFVSSISKVLLNAYKEGDDWVGDECEYYYKHNGKLTIYDNHCDSRKSNIVIIGKMGIVDATALKNIIANRVAYALSAPMGIASESAGSVSISYTSAFANGTSTSLTSNDKEILDSYKVVQLL